MSADLRVELFGKTFKNPVMTASGTFGSGMEYDEFFDISKLGAVVTKGVAAVPWEGNDTPRIAETPAGMLNAIGLQNPGVNVFLKRDLPFLRTKDTNVIVNVCGHTEEEYIEAVDRLSAEGDGIDALEINISCPNVKKGALAFGTDPAMVEKITGMIKEHSRFPVIMKLSPNVTSIAEIARAAESGGADGISLINTITGMKIDIERQKFLLANRTGGMSGPAVHPVAVRMVYEVCNAVSLPVIGMGGITCAEDAIEMLLVGAKAVSIGTANFTDPFTTLKVIEGIGEYLDRHGAKSVNEIIGIVK